MDYKALATTIIKLVGGKENITQHLHCATRLRLVLADRSKADYDALKHTPGVMGVVDKGEQLQLIIGTEVAALYNEIEEQVPLNKKPQYEKPQRKKNKATAVMETMAGIFAPIIPVIAGSGLLKTALTVLVQLGLMTEASETYKILYIAANAVFNFIPLVIAYSAAKVLKTNVILAITLAAALFYPTLTQAAAEGVEYMHVFGLPVRIVDSASSIIPVLLTTWVLKYVYDFVDSHLPKAIRMFFTSFVVLFVMIIIELVVFAPLGSYVGALLMNGLTVIINWSKLISGAFIGAFWIPLVVTGMHHGVIPLLFEELAANGSTILMPATNMANVALSGAVLAVMLRSKNSSTKSIALSAALPAVMGITEPGIYGIMIKFRNCIAATMISGAVGGAYIVLTGAVQYFFGGLGVFTPIMNLGNPFFIHHLIATVLSLAISFTITYVTFKDEVTEEAA